MVYIFAVSISAFFMYMYDRYRDNYKISLVYFFISFFSLFIIGAIRYNVGIDYMFYSNYQIPHHLIGHDVKFSYFSGLIVNLGYYLSNSTHYQYIFAIFHFVFVFFLFLYIKDNSKNKAFSVLLFVFSTFFDFGLNGMRQAMSTAVSLYSIKYIGKNNCTFIFWLLVSYNFHNSAIIYIILLILYYINIKNRYAISIVIIFSFLVMLRNDFFRFLIEKIGFYDEYIGGGFDNNIYNITITLYIFIMFSIVFYYINIVNNRNYNILFNFYNNINYLILYLSIVMPYIPNGYRLYFMFFPLYICIIPNLLEFKKIRITNILYIFIFIMYFAYFIKIVIIENGNGTLPFQIFNNW